MTIIPAGKIAAYAATDYRVGFGVDAFVLRIGQFSGALRSHCDVTGYRCSTFITAFNPLGQAQSDQANEIAHRRLGEHLRALTTDLIEGEGADPAGTWPPEKSYFALGIGLHQARRLGRLYKQDAVIWIGADWVPQLILLR